MSPEVLVRRIDRLREGVHDRGLSGLLVTHLPNIRYLTGFSGSSAVLFVSVEETVFFSDFRYREQAEDELQSDVRVEIVKQDLWDRVWGVIDELEPEAVGYEAHSLTVKEAERFDDTRRETEFRGVTGLVEKLRESKDAAEVDLIRQAAQLAGEALSRTLSRVRPGMSELQVAGELERELRIGGSEWFPFPTIVASGPRSALPHAGTTDRVLELGDILLLDFGAQVEGYCADITRTVVLGSADERQGEVYQAVREAQQLACHEIRAGMTGREADAIARGYLEERGLGDAFGHSLGHGLGLEVHEGPRVSQSSEDPLPEGSVITVEPGVYLSGWGGIRIEDDVHLGAQGPELLSDGATELLELR